MSAVTRSAVTCTNSLTCSSALHDCLPFAMHTGVLQISLVRVCVHVFPDKYSCDFMAVGAKKEMAFIYIYFFEVVAGVMLYVFNTMK